MTNEVNVRELALAILLAVTQEGEYSHIARKAVLDKYQYLTKQERSFITRVSEGTLEHMIWIDYVIDQFSSVKVSKMKPVIRGILRNGVYELKYMDAVPKSATCNEAVKLAQKKGFGRLKGFVNGILRNISRNLEHIALPDRAKDETRYLSIRYSMPEWIIQQWLCTYSTEQTEQILQSFLQEGPTSIRVNTSKITPKELERMLKEEGVTVRQNQRIPYGLYISDYDYLEHLKTFQRGLFYVQDTSSMMAGHTLGVKQGDYVLDVCAAPGGKSIHIAELLKGTGIVEARDLTRRKVEMIRENIVRSGLTNIRAVVADAREFRPEDIKKADIVIADLPCSGLGVIGKKPDIKYRVTQEQQKELVFLQREILHTVEQYVKPGGTLLYSTCTISRRENEENMEWFLKEHPWYRKVHEEQLLPEAGCQDGFFIAKLIKEKYE